MTNKSNIQERIRSYILSEVLEGALPSEITDTTSLMTGGILDSIAAMRLVMFLEREFSISIESQDIDPEKFDTIERITELVESKLALKNP